MQDIQESKLGTIAAMNASRYEPKVGDKIRTRKGGQIPGTITKIEGNKVHFTHPEGKKYHTHIENVMKEEHLTNEAYTPSAAFLARAAASREKLSSTGRKKLEKNTGVAANKSISATQAGKTTTTKKPETISTQAKPADRIQAIKNAAEKLRLRKAAASNRKAFGGELGGGFSMPGSSFRRYSEETEKYSKSSGTADSDDKTTKRQYLGKSRGRTLTGSPADIINTKPKIEVK